MCNSISIATVPVITCITTRIFKYHESITMGELQTIKHTGRNDDSYRNFYGSDNSSTIAAQE